MEPKMYCLHPYFPAHVLIQETNAYFVIGIGPWQLGLCIYPYQVTVDLGWHQE